MSQKNAKSLIKKKLYLVAYFNVNQVLIVASYDKGFQIHIGG